MVLYNFKSIGVVPGAKDFIDIVLSRTQRKTPTVVHQGYQISRIRKFYMRKIKFTQTNYHEKVTQILDEFPRLDDIHPFYADLINVLYSRDHYKLALGQLSTARSLVDNVGKDYLKLLKFGDSLYRCKELKRAALGRMCTVMKKLGPSLAYLEQVRQHLSRLPSIDPSTRTMMITGYPNVRATQGELQARWMELAAQRWVALQFVLLCSSLASLFSLPFPSLSPTTGRQVQFHQQGFERERRGAAVRLHDQVAVHRPPRLQVHALAGDRHARYPRPPARGEK